MMTGSGRREALFVPELRCRDWRRRRRGAAEANANARARAAYESSYAPPPPPGPRNIQTSLMRLGHDPGPVDGTYGQRTADVISQYQYSNRLSVDGRPSPQLLDHMIRHGG